MAKKRTGIRVIIYKTKHKSQPYRVDIDGVGPGPMETLRERYARPYTAKRGAIRNLKAWSLFPGQWNVTRQDEAIPVTFEQVGK
jgi:hypothetical protein